MIDLVACSLCRRVRRDAKWLDAACVIREVSSYAEAISRRRADAQEREAAK